MRYKMIRIALLLAVIAGWLILYKLYRPPQFTKVQTVALGTFVEITYPQQTEAQEKKVRQGITSILVDVNNTLSVYEPSSEVSTLNRNGEVVAGPDFRYVMKKSMEASCLSNGAFDITVQPLIEMWEHAREVQRFPEEQTIRDVRSLVSYRKVRISDSTISFLEPGMKVNLGGIAKGYAIDRITEFLRIQGITNALVNIGGDMRVIGKGPDTRGWTIGIAHPRHRGGHIATLRLKNMAVATSGDYERYFMLDGKRVSHIIDPRTGYTVTDVPVSVTVLADSAIDADALATALFVLGPVDGIALVDTIPNAEAFILDAKGNAFYSQSWPGERNVNIDLSGNE